MIQDLLRLESRADRATDGIARPYLDGIARPYLDGIVCYINVLILYIFYISIPDKPNRHD